MALSTKSVVEWAASIRNIFTMGDGPAQDTRSTNGEKEDDDVPMKDEASSTDDEGQTHHQPRYLLSSIERESDAGSTSSTSSSAGGHREDGMVQQISLEERMELAKQRYPGAKDWARDEERLFEILFSRQDLPIMPSHWSIDFRGVPLTERVFETSRQYPPIVYACEKNGMTDFAATTSITRLIDLTLAVRTLLESRETASPVEQRRKRRQAAALIKERLDEILRWAARDGGYDKLQYVPNIVAEVIEAPEIQSEIVAWMTARMTALVRLQQEYLREDKDDNFWDSTYPTLMGSSRKKGTSSRKRRETSVLAGIKRGTDTRPHTPDLDQGDLKTESTDTLGTPRASEFGSIKRQLFKKRRVTSDGTELGGVADVPTPKKTREPIIKTESPDDTTPKAFKPATEKALSEFGTPTRPVSTVLLRKTPPTEDVKYRRKPPVVYGLFVLGTSVLILTADASKGSSAYVSFHLDISFADNHQSVWNALTIATIACLARDELMTRTDDFKPTDPVYESDPDA